MTATLTFRDLHPFQGDLAREDHDWLRAIGELDPRDYRVGIDDDRPSDDFMPLVRVESDGQWWAGRHIGAVSFQGRRLVIEPRLGIEVVEAWLDQAFGLSAPPASAQQEASDTFIARLLARLWCRAVDNATRHGLPLLRLPRRHEGQFVRGRLDVKRTSRLLREGKRQVASITHDKSLVHPATRAIVCAERALAERLSQTSEWRTPRVKQVLPHLRAAVGSRPALPTVFQISRVRYTPITVPFRQVALLSHRIASRLGYSASDEEGVAEGILIDVAELWELFVLNCVRQAVRPGSAVEHGSVPGQHDFLLQSERGDQQMGRLKPDVLVLQDGTVAAVLDAKYKRLHDTRDKPTGVDPADLYQVVSYALRFKPQLFSALVYPRDPEDETGNLSHAEAHGPWLGDDRRFRFERLPTDVDGCSAALTSLLNR